MIRRHCLTLDLKNDPQLIAEYREHHRDVWPEIRASFKDSGILDMEIYLRGTRLFMIIEVDGTFSFERKARADAANAKVQEWERLMWTFQQAIAGSEPGSKWVEMERIFKWTNELLP
jgi:L-rhamnose mutarotase